VTKRRRRSSRGSLGAKLRRNLFVIVVLLLLLGWGLFSAVTWPGFRPRSVEVTGTSRVDPGLVRVAARISLNSNLWLIDPWSLAARVDAIPYVLSVELLRALPNRIALAIRERHPESCLVLGGDRVTIDDSQRVLERDCHMAVSYRLLGVKAASPGVTVSDPALARLRADVRTLAGQRIDAKSASFDRDGGLVVITREGTRLLLGEDSLLPSMSELLGPIFDAVRKQGRRASQIDLRAPSTPVVRYVGRHKESRARKGKPRGGA
jgi:hypothetical protein